MIFIEKLKNSNFPFTPMDGSKELRNLYSRTINETLYENNIMIKKCYEDDIYPNSSTLVTFLHEKDNREFIKLYEDFRIKFESKKDIFRNHRDFVVFNNIKNIFDSLSLYNPSYIKFDLTADISVFFQASVNKNIIYIELFFAEENPDNEIIDVEEIIVNIYKKSKVILAYGDTTINGVFSKIDSIFNNISNCNHGISNIPFAPRDIQTNYRYTVGSEF